MAFVILESCIKSGDCVAVCPPSAIAEGDEQFYIDPTRCIECGLCAPECPVDAIVLDVLVPAESQPSIAENADFFA